MDRSLRISLSFAGGDGRTIHREPADHERREHVIVFVIPKNKNPAPGWWDCNVIHRWDSQLTSVGQMDREWHEWHGMNEFANISSHTVWSYTTLATVKYQDNRIVKGCLAPRESHNHRHGRNVFP